MWHRLSNSALLFVKAFSKYLTKNIFSDNELVQQQRLKQNISVHMWSALTV